MLPPVEYDLGYRFRRRTLNPNPNRNSDPNPNPNPKTHPNHNRIFNRTEAVITIACYKRTLVTGLNFQPL